MTTIQDILNSDYPETQTELSDLYRIGDTTFLYNTLNIIYGLEGSGKSWQVSKALGQAEKDAEVLYIDADGSN
jgi:predicted ATP-dependent serine protease